MTDKKTVPAEPVNKSYWFETIHNNSATAYASGDAVGSTQSLNTRGNGAGGLIRRLIVANNESQAFPVRIHFFRREPRAVTDDAAFTPAWPNDIKKYAGYVDVAAGDYISYGTIRIAEKANINVDFSCPDEGELWYIVEAQGAGTFAAANAILINFGDWPD
jgi:hypothetical protein